MESAKVNGINFYKALTLEPFGAQDALVVPEQLKQFSLRLQQWKVNHEDVQMDGPTSTHFFPQTMPTEVYDVILESITRPR